MDFEVAGAKIVAKTAKGLNGFALDIMSESLEQCPMDTGTLRRSSRIQPAHETAGGDIQCVIGYGFGEDTSQKTRRVAAEYAVPVHEKVEAQHKPPMKAKFLEDPVFEHAVMMQGVLATMVRSWDSGVIVTRYGDNMGVGAQLGGDSFISLQGFFPGLIPGGELDLNADNWPVKGGEM